MKKWKVIPGYCNYQVSSDGDVRRIDKSNKSNKKLSVDKKYYAVSLSQGGITKKHSVHRLVMDAFCPRPVTAEILVIRHKNFCKTDNRLVNLEWSTQKKVCCAAVKAKLAPNNSGENNGRAKLNEAVVKTIRRTYKSGDEIIMAEKYGIKPCTIFNVVTKATWKNVL